MSAPKRQIDNRGTLPSTAPAVRFVDVRGADGRLYGRFCPEQQLLEVRKGQQVEVIDLKQLSKS